MKYEIEYVRCPICSDKNATEVWDKAYRQKHHIMNCKNVIMDGDSMVHGRIVLCKTCGLIYTNPQMTKECLDEFYRNTYREIFSQKNSQQADRINTLHALSAMKTLNSLSLITKYDIQSYLDIGCNKLHLANELCKAGKEANGFDYNTSIPGIYHDFDEIHKIYDCVTCFNTLEHVKNPVEFLWRIRSFTKKFLVIGVPNIFGKFNCSVDAMFSNAHLYHFSATTICHVLNKAGFEVIKILNPEEPMCKKLHVIAKLSSLNQNIVYPRPVVENIKNFFIAVDRYQIELAKPKFVL